MGPAVIGVSFQGDSIPNSRSFTPQLFPWGGNSRSPPHLRTASPQTCRIQPPGGIHIPMITFWEWLGQGYEYGFVQQLQHLIREGDEGYWPGSRCPAS
jgi:hypothetical protein